jgi:hypothetical protein
LIAARDKLKPHLSSVVTYKYQEDGAKTPDDAGDFARPAARYYSKIYNSIRSLSRVLKPSGHAIIVVQDSYYKDVHNNVNQTFIEMASHFGWTLDGRNEF